MTKGFRNELKFILHQRQRLALLERWGRYLVKDRYTNEDAVTPILSQYYDTPQLTFYEEKLDGIRFRNKLRIRTYGHRFEDGGTVFLEIKQRLGEHVRKLRQRVDTVGPDLFDPASWRFDTPAMASAFGFLRDRYVLTPTAQVWYLREAFEGIVEPDVRVTFDSLLTGAYPRERLTESLVFDPSRSPLPDTLLVLEVKSTGPIPRWVYQGVQEVELVQKPVPKYVMAMETLGLHRSTGRGIYA